MTITIDGLLKAKRRKRHGLLLGVAFLTDSVRGLALRRSRCDTAGICGTGAVADLLVRPRVVPALRYHALVHSVHAKQFPWTGV